MIFSFLASMCPIPGLFQWSHYDQSPGILIQGFGLFLWSDEIKSEIIKESLRNPRKLPKIFNILYFFYFPSALSFNYKLDPKDDFPQNPDSSSFPGQGHIAQSKPDPLRTSGHFIVSP